MKNFARLKKIFLLLGDIAILYLSLYLTLLLRYQEAPSVDVWQSHFSPFTPVFGVWLVIFYISDLYNLRRAVNNADFFRRTARAIFIAILLSAAFFYLNPNINIAPKRNLLIYIAVFAALFYLWRNLYNLILKSYLPKNNIAIIGYGALAQEIITELRERPHLGYQVSFIVNDRSDPNFPAPLNQSQLFSGGQKSGPQTLVIDGFARLPELIKEHKIDTIVLTADPHQSPELRNSLFACLSLRVSYITLPNFYETITGRVPLDSINQMWFLENLTEGSKKLYDSFKRIYDFFLAIAILVGAAPLALIISILIKTGSSGNIFYLSERAGKNNRSFQLIKFRTMREDNNDRSPTRVNDPRITGIGRFLRKTRLDELPQVINIIKGELSFVGPRPERPELIKELEKTVPFYRERMLVKPGATGWDQVSGEYHSPSYEDTMKKLQYDLFYIKNRSIYLDLSIILKTIATVLSRGGM